MSNLRYLCDRLKISYEESEDLPQPLAWRLMQSHHAKPLTYLAAYLRRRTLHVIEFFEKQFPDSLSQKILADINDKAGSGRNTVKPFTKLVCIYLTDPKYLELIHYNYAWRKTPTTAEFDLGGGLAPGAIDLLVQSIDSLLKSLGEINKGVTFSFFGRKSLHSGFDVFVAHRNYQAAVKPDHRNKFRLQHDYSQIVFGLSGDRSQLIVKVGNKAITEAISNWVRRTLEIELTLSGGRLFKDYDGDLVARCFLGEYDQQSLIDLVAIEFRHSSLPGGSPMSIRATEFNRSIREELQVLRERHVLRISSLAEIQSVTVRHEGIECMIECQIEKGGAVNFHLIDTNLDEDHAESVKAAFLEAFHVPVGQSINPTMMVMGTTEIYHHLLSGVDEDQVRPYQRPHLHRLVQLGLLQPVITNVGKCSDPNCIGKSQPVIDESVTDCRYCQSPLRREDHTKYKLNAKPIVRIARKILGESAGLTLSSDTHKFESHDVHRLASKSKPNEFIHVFVNERLSSEKIEVFKRAMFPIMVIHPTGQQKAPVIDSDGIAHIGFPYALTAREDAVTKKEFKKLTRGVVRRLRQMEQEQILRTSRVSRDSLCHKTDGYNDRMFESDIYNVMRRVFPHSIKLGGKNKPDGFSSLIFFETSDLRTPTKVNLSYDAKYSKGSYDFGIGEHRQMHEYIKSFDRSKVLQRDYNKYDGHMIIFTDITESAMQGASDYLSNLDRLAKTHPGFILVFMHESFLTHIWDLIHDNSAEIQKRWLSVSQIVFERIKTLNRGGYALLDQDTASSVIEAVLLEEPIEKPVNPEALVRDLEDHVTQRTNRQAPREIAASN